ncbi:MAG: hypothetical protein A2179_00270 [Elusimicrobia bacterium GWC2_63_65]|nr:MAG: hypothetical protein A2179_00270 [Elusimicrobia bacterium GWC2_63_65]
MKHLLLATLLFGSVLPVRAAQARNYADAQTDLALKSQSVAFFRKTAINAIKKQNADLEVVNRLAAAKTTVEDMIRRNNFAKACKVAEAGFTLATLGAGGITAVTAKGLSVISQEGLKIAGKYMAAGAALEVGKDATGVPSLSNVAQWSMDKQNKADSGELSSQLSSENIDTLLEAKRLIEDESDGRPLEKKLPELHQMLLAAEKRLEESAAAVKGADSNVTRSIAEFKELAAEAAKLKEKERREDEKRYEEAKLARSKELPAPQVSKPAAVPPPATAPEETPEEKRRKMQAAIDKYIAGLRAAIDRSQKAADSAWKDITAKSIGSGTRYHVADELEDLYAGLTYGEEGLGTSRTYSSLQGVELSAENAAKGIEAQRLALETQSADIKARIEPILNEIAGYIGQWRSAIAQFKPQGYYVPEAPDLETMTVWNSYYEVPLKYADGYLKGTDGLAGRYKSLAAKARGLKDGIFAQAGEFMAGYASKMQAYKDYLPQVAGQLEKLNASLARHYEILNGLSHRFTQEFAYDGKYDLANLEKALAEAKPAFSEAQRLQAAGTRLYRDLYGRYDELYQLGNSPLLSEAHTISYSAENKSHKEAMVSALKSLQGYRPDLKGAEGWSEGRDAGAEAVFAAEEALRFLKAQETKLVAAHTKARADFKANASADLSALGSLPDAQYGAAVEKLFAPVARAEEDKNSIIEEVRKAEFWGNKPWERTGFWTVKAGKAREELEKATGAFWESDQGKAINDARRRREVQQAADSRDPGAALVRKLYEDFARAYSSRDAARVLALVSPGWTAGDGTTVSELEEQLRAVFRVNNEVTATVSGLSVINEGPDRYTAYYNLNIKSRIYAKNIKREENSSVSEKVTVEGGKARILKTDSGGYWEIK